MRGDESRCVNSVDGVNVAGVTAELETFVRGATPKNGSGDGFITTKSYAVCGRERALALVERVRPILDRLYPEWRDENPERKTFEFAPEHDASQRLLERLRSRSEIDELLGDPDPAPQLDAGRLHPLVWTAASVQWSTGHLHEAVLAAAKAVNSLLQNKLGWRDVSEVKLVREAFTDKAPKPAAPRLRFDSIEDEQTRDSMRDGAMNFGVGCFQGIRNPVGHLPNDEHELTEQQALERLAAWVEHAELVAAEVGK